MFNAESAQRLVLDPERANEFQTLFGNSFSMGCQAEPRAEIHGAEKNI
jgi:hypothetical protein